MQVFDVSRSKRFVGVVERGESFVEVLHDLAMERGIAGGWVSAVGAFEAADIQVYDAETRKLGGAKLVQNADVVHLSGSISMEDGVPYADIYVVLARGNETFGGRLRGARAALVEFVVDSFEGVSLARRRDPATGLSAWSRGELQAAPPVSVSREPVSAWAMAAAASESSRHAEVRVAAKRPLSVAMEPAFQPPPLPEKKRATSTAFEDDDEPVPHVGDWVAHKQFGLCKVEGEEEGGGGLLIRLPSGVRKSLNLDYLRVLPPTETDGRRVFGLEPRKR